MARMTQTEIINTLADSSGLKKTEVKGLFDSIAELAANEVKKNGEFNLPGFGKLVKATRKAREGRSTSDQTRMRLEEHQGQVEEHEAFCDELGERPSDVALAWLLHQPGVTAPITGPRTLEQLEWSLRALEVELDDEALARLDKIWPGPGGPAPEAYAW